MNLKIISEKENHLFSRKEVIVELKREGSPKKSEIEGFLATKFSSPVDAIKIDDVVSKFGSDLFLVHAKVYKSKEDKDSIEPLIKAAKVAA